MVNDSNNKIIYPELSYQIVGILFEVHSTLGNRYQEKYYQRAVEVKFKNQNIEYKKELVVNLEIDGEKIGKYFLDFLITNKIILELKAKPSLTKVDYKQVQGYLAAKGLKLGILANFYPESLDFQRILNKDGYA